MQIFNATLSQMLLMFTLMAIGFTLRKTKILPENAGTVLSRLETYAILPALYLHSMLNKCTTENFAQNAGLIAYGAVMIVVAIGMAYWLRRLLHCLWVLSVAYSMSARICPTSF